jgi:hypothetical protein
MKRKLAAAISILALSQVSAQDTLVFESSNAGYFVTISQLPLDSLQYQESTETTADGGTQFILSTQSSGQRKSFSAAAEEVMVSVFPNPGRGIYTIRSHKAGISQIKVSSTLGVVLYESGQMNNLFSVPVDITRFEKGIYLFTITCTDGTLKTRRVILQ